MQMPQRQKRQFPTYRTHNLLTQNCPIYTRLTQEAWVASEPPANGGARREDRLFKIKPPFTLRIILTERDREIARLVRERRWLGEIVSERWRTAQHRDRLPENQPAEIAMFQISEVQESPAFNGGRSFLTLRPVTGRETT